MWRRDVILSIAATLSIAPAAFGQVVDTGFPVVVDSNGAVVGPVLDATKAAVGDTFQTALLVDDTPLLLYLGADRTKLDYISPEGFTVGLLFDAADCMGTGYIQVPAPAVPTDYLSSPAVAINDPGLSLWVPTTNIESSFTSRSFLDTITLVCVNIAPFPETGLPAVLVSTPFVGPYSLGRGTGLALSPLSVPAVGPAGLAILSLILLASGWWFLRR